MKRQASYGELAWLGEQFDQQLKEKSVMLCDEDYRSEAFMDFVSQYEDGVDNPTVNLLYPNRMIDNDILEAINEHYENQNSETRYWWLGDTGVCVCHNALSDMDDIDEVTPQKVRDVYDSIISKRVMAERLDGVVSNKDEVMNLVDDLGLEIISITK